LINLLEESILICKLRKEEADLFDVKVVSFVLNIVSCMNVMDMIIESSIMWFLLLFLPPRWSLFSGATFSLKIYPFPLKYSWGDHFRFGSVFIKKKQPNRIFFFEKKNRNRTETGSNRPVSVRFFRAKTVRFFWFWLGFLCFGSVFSVWLGFFSLARFFSGFLSVLVWFGSVWFFAYKTETEPNRQNRNRTEPAGFLKNIIGLIGFFFGSVFSVIFFQFSRFNWFFGFFVHP